jgi:DNA-binding transcriptional LysR family regulator
MYKDLGAIAIFVAVAEEGGFGKAAVKLGVTNSVISHHISKLEERLGVTLLYRSTHKYH